MGKHQLPRLGVTLLCFAVASANAASRFELRGAARLVPDAIAQHAAGFRMDAKLTPVYGPARAPLAQADGRFLLVAWADSIATACYNDTIFRNDFDGDGL